MIEPRNWVTVDVSLGGTILIVRRFLGKNPKTSKNSARSGFSSNSIKARHGILNTIQTHIETTPLTWKFVLQLVFQSFLDDVQKPSFLAPRFQLSFFLLTCTNHSFPHSQHPLLNDYSRFF